MASTVESGLESASDTSMEAEDNDPDDNTQSQDEMFFISDKHDYDDDDNSSSEPSITKFECVLCNMEFEDVDDFKVHVNSHESTSIVKSEEQNFEFVEPNQNILSIDPNYTDSHENSPHALHPLNQESSAKTMKKRRFKTVYACRYCEKKFMTYVFIRDHIITYFDQDFEEDHIHQILRQFTLDKVVEQLDKHCYSITTHGQQPDGVFYRYGCLICQVDFSEKMYLHSHLESCEKTIDHRYKCPDCYVIFSKKSYLNSHIRMKHSDETTKAVADLQACGDSTSSTPDNSLICSRCNKTFACVDEFIQHRQNAHNAKVPELEKDTLFYCAHCDNSYSSQAKLYAHLQMHKEVRRKVSKSKILQQVVTIDIHTKTFICNICQKSFSNKSNLNRHVSLHEVEEKKEYKCPFCSRVFSYQRYLHHHVMYMHKSEEEKNHLCTVCGQIFTTNSSLKRHMMLHTGEIESKMRFKCKYCSKRFKYNKELETHLLTHSDTRPFACDKCDYRCRSYYNLLKHNESHIRWKRKQEKMRDGSGVEKPKHKRKRGEKK